MGPKFQARLAARGLTTVADVLRHDLGRLRGWLGDRAARWLWNRAHGIDESRVAQRAVARGISRDETFGRDLHDDRDLDRELLVLVTRAASDLRADRLGTRTVTVRIRDHDFLTRSAQRTLPRPVVSDRVILSVARELLRGLRKARRVPARLLGVRLSSLTRHAAEGQIDLFAARADPGVETERDRALSKTIDGVREKFGARSILPAALTRR